MRTESEENLRVMRRIDEMYLKRPYYGYPRITKWLRKEGWKVNEKRVARLMQLMGLQAVLPGPHTSKPHPEHRIYPYLLRDLKIDRPGQVWCADITYVPMKLGFLYLVAIMDWFSRYVLAWELSNSMEATFCVAALEMALESGTPGIFNTDQGSQFTSEDFRMRKSVSAWMDEDESPTTSSSRGCGGPSNTKTSICTITPMGRRFERDWIVTSGFTIWNVDIPLWETEHQQRRTGSRWRDPPSSPAAQASLAAGLLWCPNTVWKEITACEHS
jgi:hypothetical protein